MKRPKMSEEEQENVKMELKSCYKLMYFEVI